MSNTALNRTTVALLTNKSGGSVAQGDVVIVDSANASAFTTTTTSAYVSGSVGVVLEPNGIASNATGTVAFAGYVPLVNLSSSASLGDVFHTHTVAKQALRHAAPVVAGDFGQVLGTGTTPAAFLWSQPTVSGGGGGSTTLAGDTDVSISSPADGQALIYDGAHWANKKPWVRQLDYTLGSDISSLSMTLNTWTDIIANQNVTVDDANSIIEVSVRGVGLYQSSTGVGTFAVRLIVDSAGTPVTELLSGCFENVNNPSNLNPFAGTSPIFITGLSAATHTIKLQGYAENSTAAGLIFIRPSTHPNTEFLRIQAMEWK